MSTWLACQAKFYFSYVLGIWSGPNPSRAWGTAIDEATNHGHREKRDRRDPSHKDCQDRFAAAFDIEREQIEDWEEESPDAMLDEGARHIEKWTKETLPNVEPYDVQKPFKLLVADYQVRGVIDVTMSRTDKQDGPFSGIYVCDQKTSKKSWSKADLGKQMQAIFYSLAADTGQLVEGVDSSRVAFRVFVRLKRGPRQQNLIVGIGPEQKQHTLNLIETARRAWKAAYQASAWTPNRNHFACRRRYCTHWERCEKEHGGTVAH